MRGELKAGIKAGLQCAILLCISSIALAAQKAVGDGAASHLVSIIVSSQTEASQSSGQVYREIVDPNNGDRWLLLRNNNRPGGPGRLVLAQPTVSGPTISSLSRAPSRQATAEVAQIPVIRSGDRLIVERSTAIVEERLEAVALGPAVTGASFDVRMVIGGKVFRAVALGPGRATFDSRAGGQP